jgi:hypothetical protein
LELGSAALADTGDFAPALGADDNYVTDAQLTVIGNTSGTNTGDQDLSGYITDSYNQFAFSDTTSFILEGDSLTAGTGRPKYQDYFSTFITDRITITNVAQGGRALAGAASNYAANVFPLRPAVTGVNKAYLFFWVGANGSNDTGVYPNASDFIAAWNSYTAQAKADGFTIVAFTILPHSVYSVSRRIEINQGIRQSVNADIVIDVERLFPDKENTLYFEGDQIHLLAAAQSRIASHIESVFSARGISDRRTPEREITVLQPKGDFTVEPSNTGAVLMTSRKSGVGFSWTVNNSNATTTKTMRRDTAPFVDHQVSVTGSTGPFFNFGGTFISSSATQVGTTVAPTITQSGTAGYTALRVNPTQTTTGSGLKLLLDLAVGGTRKASVNSDGTPLFFLPTYANDAAADADAALLSGMFYKVTGNRTVFQKP